MNKKLIENMETKLFRLRKDLNDAHDKVNFLINDLNKLKSSEEDSNTGEFREMTQD